MLHCWWIQKQPVIRKWAPLWKSSSSDSPCIPVVSYLKLKQRAFHSPSWVFSCQISLHPLAAGVYAPHNSQPCFFRLVPKINQVYYIASVYTLLAQAEMCSMYYNNEHSYLSRADSQRTAVSGWSWAEHSRTLQLLVFLYGHYHSRPKWRHLCKSL